MATKRYYITHTAQNGERHQLTGAWEAETPEDALVQMFGEAAVAAPDDGWEAHLVTSDADVIE